MRGSDGDNCGVDCLVVAVGGGGEREQAWRVEVRQARNIQIQVGQDFFELGIWGAWDVERSTVISSHRQS